MKASYCWDTRFFIRMEKYLHAWRLIAGISYKMLRKIHIHFRGNFEEAWKTKNVELYQAFGVKLESAFNILQQQKKIDVDLEYQKVSRKNIRLITQDHLEFPAPLKNIPCPPFLLYRKGKPLHEYSKSIAIVGTRLPSAYGQKTAFDIAKEISSQKGNIISGLAFGIDSKAHLGALAGKSPTIAILPSGLANVTPASNNYLTQAILEAGGTLLSEYSPFSPAYKYHFLERNRLISGISEATVVIEAPLKSGALITAKHALEQGKNIYALPGDIYRPQSQGCLQLIAEGATPIVSIQKLLLDLGFEKPSQEKFDLSPDEKNILQLLQSVPQSTDQLLEKVSSFEIHSLQSILSQLELKGLIQKNHAFCWETRT